MKKVALLMALFVALMFLAVNAEETNNYVGVKKCKMCHKSEKSGNQFGIWSESPHAKAYETLGGEKAKEIATGMDIENPQTSEKCLVCHVTAYGVPAEQKTETLTLEESVSCEQCHGPGSAYKKIMKDHEKAVAAGLLVPDEKTCTVCHNENSPTFKEFKYEERVKEIAHPKPKKEEAKG